MFVLTVTYMHLTRLKALSMGARMHVRPAQQAGSQAHEK